MKKKALLLATLVLSTLMLSPASHATGERITYEVYTNGSTQCWNGGPPWPYGVLVGEWTRECDGTYTGWGDQPYQYPICDFTVVTSESCGPPHE
jgi:hypothetical protein